MWRKSRSNRKESVPTREAREGAQRAEQELEEVRQRRHVVEDLAATIVEAMRRNHFGEQIERSIALRRSQ